MRKDNLSFISFIISFPISSSLWDILALRVFIKLKESEIAMLDTSTIDLPSMVTDRASLLSLVPRHFGQTSYLINLSICVFISWDSVDWYFCFISESKPLKD